VEAVREELFLEGTTEGLIAAKPDEKTHPAIVYPERGQIIAIDPDIPEALQREHRGGIADVTVGDMRIDGEKIHIIPPIGHELRRRG